MPWYLYVLRDERKAVFREASEEVQIYVRNMSVNTVLNRICPSRHNTTNSLRARNTFVVNRLRFTAS